MYTCLILLNSTLLRSGTVLHILFFFLISHSIWHSFLHTVHAPKLIIIDKDTCKVSDDSKFPSICYGKNGGAWNERVKRNEKQLASEVNVFSFGV